MASASPDPIAPPDIPDPAPQLAIESPTLDQKFNGSPSPTPDDKFTDMPCLQDSRTFGIKLSAKNWSVKSGGHGVLIVIDGVYAANVHDLAKPVKVVDLAPYEYKFEDKMPLSSCGFQRGLLLRSP